jgi:hypothetical protein
MTVKCTRIRQSRFIERDIVFNISYEEALKRFEKSVSLRPGFEEIGMKFFRNRVETRFDYGESPSDRKAGEMEAFKIRESIKEFCDTKVTGYWTWKFQTRRKHDEEGYEFQIDLMFEETQDMELWLKDHGVLLKLTY